MNKRLLSFFISILLIFGAGFAAFAGNEEISVYIDGKYLKTDVLPINSDGRLLAPARAFSEALGAAVYWDSELKQITIKKDDINIALHIGSKTAYINKNAFTLDAAPQSENGITFLPLRFIVENLGYNVRYNPEKPAVIISRGDSPVMSMHFLDVGQGDSIFVILPDGETMLVDGGNSENGKMIANYIRANSSGSVDYLVATHPHSDHIGGLPFVIKEIGAKKYYMPGISQNTQIFQSLITEINNRNAEITTAKAGVTVTESENFSVKFLAPKRDNYKNINDFSAVIMITYGNRRFLLTGDAETVSEKEMVNDRQLDIKADVLKVGHHGSTTSTSPAFLAKVNPSVSVISVGENNAYNLPDNIILSRLKLYGSEIYRTDISGTITVFSDGESLDVKTKTDDTADKTEAVTPATTVYVTKSGKKYHLKDCPAIKNSENLSPLSFDEAAKKYSPCGICKPAA